MCLDKKREAAQFKQKIEHGLMHQNVLTKEGTLKRFCDRVKQYRQKRIFQNNKRKFYQQEGRECTNTYQQPDEKKQNLLSNERI